MRRLLYESKELSQISPDGPRLAFRFVISWGRLLYEHAGKEPTWQESDEFEHLDKWVRHLLELTRSNTEPFSADEAVSLLEQRRVALEVEPHHSHPSPDLDEDDNKGQSGNHHRRSAQSATVENEPLRPNQVNHEPIQEDEPEMELTEITLALSREVTLEELKH